MQSKQWDPPRCARMCFLRVEVANVAHVRDCAAHQVVPFYINRLTDLQRAKDLHAQGLFDR